MPLPILPPRLREVLALLLQGHSEKQIARDLGLSPHTVHAYVKSLHKVFGAASRGELLAICYRMLLDDARRAATPQPPEPVVKRPAAAPLRVGAMHQATAGLQPNVPPHAEYAPGC